MSDRTTELHAAGQPHHPEGCERCAVVDGRDTLPDTKWGHLDRTEDQARKAAWKWETAWADFESTMNQTSQEQAQMEQQLRGLPNRLER